ncbi:MAG: sigma-54-dependent Fis family transcriptional regulator [Deltaproteobacteria bacterium]|nr:sigma-54-dependent Fis family transcriptional regulator [Deltaproteobacteria bacterium]MCW5802749.1 sigma-54-dependent Fis family transcriptional regulator [Deltaproteobacteria bacterium]
METSVRHVLVVDADPTGVAYANTSLAGMEVEAVATPVAALERVVGSPFDVVLFDPSLGGDDDDALGLLHRLRTVAPDTVVVIWSEQPTVSFAVRAMRAGALDVLKKTAAGAEIRSVVDRAISHGALAREVRRLRGEVERARGLGEIVGESSLMRQLLAMIDRVAASDATVLIVGESGTGKELLARTIHRVGPRKDGPFVAFDCSALAPSLLEAELFGHEKGAFTGAGRARRGLFREANGGTIFLDEIGDIDASVQNKLLRVLQEREIKPVGGDRPVAIDVRVVAATNKDLKALVARGQFREDLYWRLAVVPIQVPPLRERKEDIPLLAAHILARRRGAAKSFAGSEARYPGQITAKALARLQQYRWPGNIRELENVLSRAAILCDGEMIRSHDLDMLGLDRPVGTAPAGGAEVDRVELPTIDLERLGDGEGLKDITDRAVRTVERAAIAAALRRERNPATAARRLGISRASIYTKMKAYGLGADGSPVE